MDNNSDNKADTDTDNLLRKMDEQAQRVIAIRRELTKESDRGCALMAASFLENELMVLLNSKLVGDKKFKEDLFEFNGPLGNFYLESKWFLP